MLVQVSKYIVDTDESILLPSPLIGVISDTPRVSVINDRSINERPGKFLFRRRGPDVVTGCECLI